MNTIELKFQHTATRRWLLRRYHWRTSQYGVSTHSHPKVAADRLTLIFAVLSRFNTQPPEGGCSLVDRGVSVSGQFQHTATRRWLQQTSLQCVQRVQFQHTATRRWLPQRHVKPLRMIEFQHTATRRWLLPT